MVSSEVFHSYDDPSEKASDLKKVVKIELRLLGSMALLIARLSKHE